MIHIFCTKNRNTELNKNGAKSPLVTSTEVITVNYGVYSLKYLNFEASSAL